MATKTKSSGMFGKDKEIGAQLQTTIDRGKQFVLWGASVEPEAVKTDLGMADKTTLVVSFLAQPQRKFEVGSLSGAISEKAKDADPADFPCIVYWTKVESKRFPGTEAVVLQWVKDYEGEIES